MSAPDRPCLILIPGLLNDAELWRDQVAALSPLFDVRVADITQAETLEAAAEAILADAPERLSVAGFSLGGYAAQAMLRAAPERIERLALLDTAIRPDTPERARERRALEAMVDRPGRFHGFGGRLIQTYLAPGHAEDEAMTARVRGMTERLGVEVFLRQSGFARLDGEAVLRAFEGPALVLCGEVDAITPLEGHREIAAMIPRAELVIVPGCGHLTPIEAPDLVSDALRRWMERD